MAAARKTILVIDDDDDIRHTLRFNLAREGYRVLLAPDGKAGLALFNKIRPDFVVLDVMMPKMDGLEVLRRIRAESEVPALLLSGKGEEFNRVLGLRLGADDYVVKPFSMEELIVRIQRILRRGPSADGRQGSAFRAGDMHVDFERYDVRVAGRYSRLTPKEFAILKVLIEAKGKALSRQRILQMVWGHDDDAILDTRTVDQHVARLRRKLLREGRRLVTVPTVGYKFESAPKRRQA